MRQGALFFCGVALSVVSSSFTASRLGVAEDSQAAIELSVVNVEVVDGVLEILVESNGSGWFLSGVAWSKVVNAVTRIGSTLIDDPERVRMVEQIGVDETLFQAATYGHRQAWVSTVLMLWNGK